MTFEKALHQVADQYRAKGYGVVVAPGKCERPGFAQDMEIDLLANKPGEKNVVVEVKLTRQDLIGDEEMVRLAKVVNAQPGWRFDLVVLNATQPDDHLIAAPQEPSEEQLKDNLSQAHKLLAADQLPAALLLAWSMLEAAMRRAARQLNVELEGFSALDLLSILAEEKTLSLDDLRELQTILRVRNSVAHGMSLDSVRSETVELVLRQAESLLNEPRVAA